MLPLEFSSTGFKHAWNELRSQWRLPLAILATSSSSLPSRNFATSRSFVKDVPPRRSNHFTARWVMPHVKDDCRVFPNSLKDTLEAHRDANRASLIQTHIVNDSDNGTLRPALDYNVLNIRKHYRRNLNQKIREEGVDGVHSKHEAEWYRSRQFTVDYEGQSQAPRNEWRIPSRCEHLGYAKRPWLAHLDASESGADSVHDYLTAEILAFERYMESTASEKAAVEEALTDLRKTIASLDPDIKVSVIGSRGTGLAMPLSDIDINLERPNLIRSRRGGHIPWVRGRQEAQVQVVDLLRLVRQRLKKRGGPNNVFYNSIFIDARVPIVQARHCATDLEIQIQSTTDGLSSMEIIKTYIDEFPTLRPLFFVLRQMLKMRGLGEPRNYGIGSYTLIMMIVATLKFSGERYLRTDAARQLLYFLDFYSTIDFKTSGIAIDPPELFTKGHKNSTRSQMAETTDDGGGLSTGEMTTSEANNDNNTTNDILSGRRRISVIDKTRPYLMCLQDPVNENNDLGHNALAIKHIQATFANLRQRFKISMDNFGSRSRTSASTSLLLPCLAGNYNDFELKRIALQKVGGETVVPPRVARTS